MLKPMTELHLDCSSRFPTIDFLLLFQNMAGGTNAYPSGNLIFFADFIFFHSLSKCFSIYYLHPFPPMMARLSKGEGWICFI